jgi:hypothetical protein
MKRLLMIGAALLLIGSGCAKCIKSHQEIRSVPATTKRVMVGKIWTTRNVPAHDESFTVCDQYEEVKAPPDSE